MRASTSSAFEYFFIFQKMSAALFLSSIKVGVSGVARQSIQTLAKSVVGNCTGVHGYGPGLRRFGTGSCLPLRLLLLDPVLVIIVPIFRRILAHKFSRTVVRGRFNPPPKPVVTECRLGVVRG